MDSVRAWAGHVVLTSSGNGTCSLSLPTSPLPLSLPPSLHPTTPFSVYHCLLLPSLSPSSPAAYFNTCRFPSHSFGFWWAVINQSSFLVALFGSPIANSWAHEHSWRIAIQMPAVISMLTALAFYFANFNRPSEVGYLNQDFKRGKQKCRHLDSNQQSEGQKYDTGHSRRQA